MCWWLRTLVANSSQTKIHDLNEFDVHEAQKNQSGKMHYATCLLRKGRGLAYFVESRLIHSSIHLCEFCSG